MVAGSRRDHPSGPKVLARASTISVNTPLGIVRCATPEVTALELFG
jgi:hypothetical protein